MADLLAHGCSSDALKLSFEVLEKLPREGWIRHGTVDYNSDADLLRARVSVQVGEETVFSHEIYQHNDFAEDFLTKLLDLAAQNEVYHRKITSDSASPEVCMMVHRSGSEYEFILAIDSGAICGENGPSSQGPAVYLEPDLEDLVQFLRDLRAESEVALLLGWMDG